MSHKAIETPYADTLFKPSSWLAKIDFINHLVLFNNVLMVLLAEKSGGKSAFVSLLQKNLDTSIKYHVMTADAPFQSRELLAQMTATLHLRDDAAPTLDSIIEQINERKAQVLVIIDDAQHLPDTFLQEVLRSIIKQGDAGFFHLCLVADYSLVGSLNKINNDEFKNLIHSMDLGSLNETETKTYLLRYLPPSKHLEKAMSGKQLKAFFELTEGNMAHINAQMNDFFSPESLNPSKKSRSFYKPAAVLASIVIASVAGAYFWQHVQFNLPQVAGKTMMSAAISSSADQALVSQIPAFDVAVISQPVQPSPLKSKADGFYAQDEEMGNDDMVVMDKVLVIPKSLTKRTTVPADILLSSLVPFRSFAQKEIIRSLPKVTVQTDAPAKRSPGSKTSTNRLVTIQILAGTNRKDMMRFINEHPLNDVKIRQVRRGGRMWYILTVGEFAQMEEAKKVMHHLPSSVMSYKPWIRSVSGLTSLG